MIHSTPTAVSVTFVLPCLDEAVTIEWCVKRAHDALSILKEKHGFDGEVIVADNGSTDGSQELAEAAGARVVDIPVRGYGAALLGGFSAANGKYLVMGDSDCSYDFIEAVPMVEKLMAGADLCMGSRFKGEIKPGAMPWKNRYIGNPVLSGVLRLLFKTSISDSHCGIRAISREAYDRLNLSSTGMEFASEMVLKSALMNLRFDEVPVTLSPDGRGRPPHLNPWRDGARHLIYMLLLSPSWLFMGPALLLTLFGTAILTIILTGGDAEMVRIGRFGIGDHWAIVGSAAIVIGVQTGLLGMMGLLHSYREGFRKPAGIAGIFLQQSRLQYWLLAGSTLGVAGLVWVSTIAGGWISSEFGALNEMRSLVSAFTLIIIGFQIFYTGFLLSILSGNRSRHQVALG